MALPPIHCLVCGKAGQYGDVGLRGWRMAANRMGGYTCSPVCDDVITAYDKAQKDAKKSASKKD
jgi:predicted nucleic acid-binding Zn ribbon protein